MVYLDIPTAECIGAPNGAWRHIATFPSKEAAVAFIRKELGHCDDDGNICLLTEGQDEE